MSYFRWPGERLWLDAVNSEFMREGQRTDGWGSLESFQSWLLEAAERHPDAAALRGFSFENAGDNEWVLAEAKHLRARLRLACETAHREVPAQAIPAESLAAVNAALKHRGIVLQVEQENGVWHEREIWSGAPESVLWLLGRSAAQAWTHGELARVKPCGNPKCILWFMDTSKNGTRRWCSMEGCGNRHKAAAHHQRRKMGNNG